LKPGLVDGQKAGHPTGFLLPCAFGGVCF